MIPANDDPRIPIEDSADWRAPLGQLLLAAVLIVLALRGLEPDDAGAPAVDDPKPELRVAVSPSASDAIPSEAPAASAPAASAVESDSESDSESAASAMIAMTSEADGAPAAAVDLLAAREAELAAQAARERARAALEKAARAWGGLRESWAAWSREARASVAADRRPMEEYAAKLDRVGADFEARAAALDREEADLRSDLLALRSVPDTPAPALSTHNPFAKPTTGREFHFELRGERIAFVDIERLVDLIKADARINLDMARRPRVIESRVAPVGAFAATYVVGPRLDDLSDALVRSGTVRMELLEFEIVPTRESRGDPLEALGNPASDLGRAVRRLDPRGDTVTLWVYPDAFPLYRAFRDRLHALGFTVAARPLPEGTPIRGGPTGSFSAGQ